MRRWVTPETTELRLAPTSRRTERRPRSVPSVSGEFEGICASFRGDKVGIRSEDYRSRGGRRRFQSPGCGQPPARGPESGTRMRDNETDPDGARTSGRRPRSSALGTAIGIAGSSTGCAECEARCDTPRTAGTFGLLPSGGAPPETSPYSDEVDFVAMPGNCSSVPCSLAGGSRTGHFLQ